MKRDTASLNRGDAAGEADLLAQGATAGEADLLAQGATAGKPDLLTQGVPAGDLDLPDRASSPVNQDTSSVNQDTSPTKRDTTGGRSVDVAPEHWVAVGRLGRPHGIKGEVTVEVRTDDPDHRFAAGALLLRLSGTPLAVTRPHWHSGRLLINIDGVIDRNAAENLRDTVVYADTTLDPELGDDDFYDHQLVGLRVEREDGTLVGVIADVLHPPGADLLAVSRDGMDEVLVPFVRALVPIVDRAAGFVTLIPPPGLLDERDASGDIVSP